MANISTSKPLTMPEVLFFIYKNFHSIVPLAAVDAQYRFLVNIGESGFRSDGGVLGNSAFGKALERAGLANPSADSSIPGLPDFPYCFVGDAAFPLRGHLMQPYPGKQLTHKQNIFNYWLSWSRRIVENAFGILVARWRIFRQPIVADPHNVERFVKATVVLHNFLSVEHSAAYCPSDFVNSEVNDAVTPGSWRDGLEDAGITPIGRSATNNFTTHSKDLRDRLAPFLVSSSGAVDGK